MNKNTQIQGNNNTIRQNMNDKGIMIKETIMIDGRVYDDNPALRDWNTLGTNLDGLDDINLIELKRRWGRNPSEIINFDKIEALYDKATDNVKLGIDTIYEAIEYIQDNLIKQYGGIKDIGAQFETLIGYNNNILLSLLGIVNENDLSGSL
jgi:hypothetical protein